VIKPDLPGFVPALEDRDVLQQRPPKLLWASAFIFSATRVKGSNGAQRVGCCYCDDCVLLMFISHSARCVISSFCPFQKPVGFRCLFRLQFQRLRDPVSSVRAPWGRRSGKEGCGEGDH